MCTHWDALQGFKGLCISNVSTPPPTTVCGQKQMYCKGSCDCCSFAPRSLPVAYSIECEMSNAQQSELYSCQ